MMATNESDVFRSTITVRVYSVKKIVNQMVVLETPDGTNQVLTDLRNLKLFYEREPKKDEDQG